jgi:pimeloyl-ACP methyl ester carboxylesterase
MSSSSSPVLVLVHAFPMGAGMWRPQLEVAPGWRIVAPPLAGFDGRALPTAASMDAYARDLLGSLDAMAIGRAVFCGLSMGGYVIFALLRQAPERVAGLILADTRTSTDNPERRAARQRSIELARRSGPAAIADEMLPNILGPTTRAQRPEVVAELRRLIESQPAETIATALEAMINRADASDVLAQVSVPTTMIVGEEDTVTPVSDAEQMQRLVPGSTVVTIPAAGHMANLEAPEPFNAAMRTLLARARS